jgi:hypothetical protein
MGKLRFSEPYPLEGRPWRAVLGYVPIVYRVRIWEADGSKPKSVPRAGGVDADGILDIGESGHGRGRLDRFAKVALGEKLLSHRAGIEFSTKWGYDFASVFPPEQLRIDVLEVGSKQLAEAIEVLLLETYRWTFKDRPPLNGSAGKTVAVESWLRGQQREPRVDGWLDLKGLIDHLLEDAAP